MDASERKLFVLDTNVLMHDPSCLFRFAEHDLYIPMVVLEELDASKKGSSEVARNARQVSRFIDDLIDQNGEADIDQGLTLPAAGLVSQDGDGLMAGRLFLQTTILEDDTPLVLPGRTPDNSILATTLALKGQHAPRRVVLVSKDINLRIKARVLGIPAEDYQNDRVLDDASLLYTGVSALAEDFWDEHAEHIRCWQEEGRTYYGIQHLEHDDYFPNQCLYLDEDQGLELIVRESTSAEVRLEQALDYRNPRNGVWGICARNREQNFALNMLMDPEVEFLTLLGVAGTGKTLMALAAGLTQCMEMKRYREIVVTRVTVPVGEDIGFLPGTEEEKMTPWMGALMDNLEVLGQADDHGDWGRAATADLLQQRIKIRSLNFMRGRTFLNRFVIIDEAQNLTAKQMKTLITRAGPGTKMVCLGNIAQIDTPYLTETTSGLTYVVDRFKEWEHSGHIILSRGERSRLADFASQNL